MPPPRWIKPQLCKLATKAPRGPLSVDKIKFDGYRMSARIENGAIQLLIRAGLDWTAKYPTEAAALAKLKSRSAYLDGELCGVRPDGVTSFELMQQASDRGGAGLVYFAFDLLELDGEDLTGLPLSERKTRLASLLTKPPNGIEFRDHEGGDGEAFRRAACRHGLEGMVSKRLDRHYLPDDRSAWVKTKCLNRGEFVTVGWSDPEGTRPLRVLPLVGCGTRRHGHVAKDPRPPSPSPQAAEHSANALGRASAARTRFGGKLALSRVHWVRPELVTEITYLTWAKDGLLRHTVFVGLREDKPAREVRRETPA